MKDKKSEVENGHKREKKELRWIIVCIQVTECIISLTVKLCRKSKHELANVSSKEETVFNNSHHFSMNLILKREFKHHLIDSTGKILD